MMNVSTLRPGLLVSVKTSVRGNIHYNRRDLVVGATAATGEEIAKWETERTIADPAEHEAATKTVTKAAGYIRRLCTWSAFGLLCPEAAKEDLDKAIAEARQEVEAFNSTAKLTRISVNIIAGRVAADDVEAVRAINGELRELMERMEEGVANLDTKKIREAANKARGMGQMLSDDAQIRVEKAIKVARDAARQITKAGEQAAQEVDTRAIRLIKEARTAFLDLEPVADVVAPKAEGRTLDLTPMESVKAPKLAAAAAEVE